jgi:16S rRNA (guanine527-N7)-methyltransferase
VNPALAQVESSVSSLGLRLPAGAIERFDRYLSELLHWRARLNLTAAATATEIVTAHFTESLIPLATWPIGQGSRAIDVGSGAGFPGVPIKIVRPDLRVVLLEASRRRAAFLEHLRRVLELEGLDVAWARAEDLGRRKGFREGFALAVERAVAKIAASAELCLPLVQRDGVAILLKGPAVMREIERVSPLLTRIGGALERAQPWTVGASGRTTVAVVIRKIADTPDEYPRRGPRMGRGV